MLSVERKHGLGITPRARLTECVVTHAQLGVELGHVFVENLIEGPEADDDEGGKEAHRTRQRL